MNSSVEQDIVGIIGFAVVIAGALLLLVLGALAAPFIGIGIAIFIWAYKHKHSPKRKEREAQEETQQLYTQALRFAPPSLEDRFAREIEDNTIRAIALEMYEQEGFVRPPPPPAICNSIEGARYRDLLTTYINQASSAQKAEAFADALIDALPRYPTGRGLFDARRKLTNDEIEELILRFFVESDFFHKLRTQLNRNYEEQDVLPSEYKGDNCAWDYFKRTPLLPLEWRTVPVNLVNRDQHTHVVGGSGHGKTQLLQYLISRDLEEDCTVIVIDSQRQMIPKLAALDMPIEDVAYISPSHNLGINLFDVGYRKLAKQKDSERLINSLTELLEYTLSSLMQAELTARQRVVFQFAIQLGISIPNADIRTFLNILDSTEPYQEHIDQLPPEIRSFFKTEFNHRQFDSTKQELSWRIWSLLKNPTFRRIFGAQHNRFDIYKEMQQRKLILIDTDRDLLQDASGFLGRFFIAQILQAAQRRFEGTHKPVYLYIDEAVEYFDERLAQMLETARKANIGIILAHQSLHQSANDRVLSAIRGNTATKFAGGLDDSDARAMASNMRTSADFIKEQKPQHFVLYMKGEGTYSVKAPVGVVEAMDTREDDIKPEMEERYGYSEPLPDRVDEPEPERPAHIPADEEIVPSSTL